MRDVNGVWWCVHLCLQVLLVGSKDTSVIGRPLVEAARVLATVEEHVQGEKVLSFYKRRRKNSRRLRGHRQMHSVIRIEKILFDMPQPTSPQPS